MRHFRINLNFIIVLMILVFVMNIEAQLKIKDIMRQNNPAVVTILSYDQNDSPLQFGSGFIISHKGLVVTNYHVIRNAHKVAVKIKDGDVYWVQVKAAKKVGLNVEKIP